MIKKAAAILFVFVMVLSLTSCLRGEDDRIFSESESESDSFTHGEYNSSTIDTEDNFTETESETVKIPTPIPGAPKTVCIDAGHGYSDPGCTSDFLGGVYESQINEDIAQLLKEVLENRGYRVVMLRDDNKYITKDDVIAVADMVGLDYMEDKLADDARFAPYNRTVYLNALHRQEYIDIMVSLHVNSFESSSDVNGMRIYYCSENDLSARSAELCEDIVKSVNSSILESKAKYYAKNWEEAYVVTKHSDMPSALIEMGFATNKQDAENLLDISWRKNFVEAAANGIEKYFSDEN